MSVSANSRNPLSDTREFGNSVTYNGVAFFAQVVQFGDSLCNVIINLLNGNSASDSTFSR